MTVMISRAFNIIILTGNPGSPVSPSTPDEPSGPASPYTAPKSIFRVESATNWCENLCTNLEL